MSSSSDFNLSGIQLWPTMIFTRRWKDQATEAPAILAFLKALQAAQSKLIESNVAVGAKSGTGLYESNFDLFSQPNASLQKLVQFIRSSLCTSVSIANNQDARPEDITIDFVDSWYHITNGGGYHDAHWHHGCSWCGIYYLQIGSSGQRNGRSAPNGGSRFYNPIHVGGSYRDYGNEYMVASIDPPLHDGQLLLFPSFLLHSGLPYVGDQDRVVIAFNAQCNLIEGSESHRRVVMKA